MKQSKLLMKNSILLGLLLASSVLTAQSYQPSPENLAAREQFKQDRFGLFIHWGASSVLGAGEWVMNNRNIKVEDYKRLINFYDPKRYDPHAWVTMAKEAGMKYIIFISRHHDSFSNWDTQYSDWKITNTTYEKDVLKMLAKECKAQGLKLGLYYSTLDWFREDYPHQTGRTGQGTGRKGQGNYDAYFQFMKNQLTELLTNYGDIMSIWLDGHWDQTNPEGSADRTSRINWRYPELYALIHSLQPACLIGNNHHLDPIQGEDFQMFEKDLPGQNKTGLSFQAASESLPLETCETMNNSWGYNITDTRYKSTKELVHYLVQASSLGTNLLLNVGPMPDGNIQREFVDTLKSVGDWMIKYGHTIYGTSGNWLPTQPWGVVTVKGKERYVHILDKGDRTYFFLPGVEEKINGAYDLDSGMPVRFKQQPEGVFLFPETLSSASIDHIIKLVL